MADHEQIDVDFEISKAHLNTNGWNLDHYHSGNSFDANVFYLVDYRTHDVRIITVNSELAEKFRGPEIAIEELAFLISEQTLVVQETAKSGGPVSQDAENLLAMALWLYITQTQSYALWKVQAEQGQRLHALINIYGTRDNGWVRPSPINYTGTVLPVEALQKTSLDLMAQDRQRHPEWFE
ncbi:hypothetical protein [Marinobacterium sp. BA1]|uniref:hypothetical protein n=1 Tax=Marinobacterium sp. BA1 TaxID=3138931 RepID=UPI0032E7532D